MKTSPVSACAASLLILFVTGECLSAQNEPSLLPPPVPTGTRSRGNTGGGGGGVGTPGQSNVVIIPQAPEPVMVDGKKAQDLDQDQMREFLESKIQTIHQNEGAVELLKIAPGYALTMTFSVPINSVIIGDPNLVKFSSTGRVLVLSANSRTGDTSMQLLLPGDRVLNYHIFIAQNFADAQSTLNVIVGSPSGSGGSGGSGGGLSPYFSPSSGLDVKAIAGIISNYDALEQEKAISRTAVKRLPIFRKSDITSFEYYYIYVFKDGPVAITFAYRNPFSYSIRYDESRLRLQMGNMLFIPDYVSFDRTDLAPGDTSTGFAIIAEPGFSPKQPFELVWK